MKPEGQNLIRPAARSQARQFLSAGLSLLRGVTGDDAYEKYLAHHQKTSPEAVPLTPKAFFQAQMDQKWSCINGCC